jgi:hypothetical protein
VDVGGSVHGQRLLVQGASDMAAPYQPPAAPANGGCGRGRGVPISRGYPSPFLRKLERMAATHSTAHAHSRLRPGGAVGGDLRRSGRHGADRRPGHPAGRPAHHHHRCRKLSGLQGRDPGTLADGADAGPGRACRRPHDVGPYRRGRSHPPAVPSDRRRWHHLHRRCAGDRDRRAGQVAQPSVGGAFEGQGRIRLRDLRRLLLPRQEGGGDRRRQYRRSRKRST